MLSCVIVAFHRPQSLATLLAAMDDPRIERVVVNVDCDARVSETARAAGATSIDLMGNPGYATAVNHGIAACSGDVVVFLNDDVTASADALVALTRPIVDGDADVAVPLVVTPAGDTEPTVAALPTPVSLAVEWMALPDHPVPFLNSILRVQKWRRPAHRERIRSAAAVTVACRRDLINELPLPEAYFLYWEESEWFWRLAKRGARVVMEPSAIVWHQGGRDDVRPAKSRLLATNAVRCVRRTQGPLAAFVAWNVVILWHTRLVVVDGVRAAVSRSRGPRLQARLAGLCAALAAFREIR